MKKFFRLVSMLAVAGLTFAYTSCTDYSEDVNRLDERIDGHVADVNTQIDALKKTDEGLQSSINAANDAIKALQDNTASLKEELTKLSEKHDADIKALSATHAADKAALEKQLADKAAELKTALDNLNAEYTKKFSDLEAAYKQADVELKSQITQNSTKIATLESDVKNIKEVLIPAVEKQVTDLKANVEATYATKVALTDSTAKLAARITSEVAGLNASIKSVSDRLATLETSHNALKESFDETKAEHATAISNLQTKLATLEASHKTDIDAVKDLVKAAKEAADAAQTAADEAKAAAENAQRTANEAVAAAANAQTAAEAAQETATEALGKVDDLIEALGVYAQKGELEAKIGEIVEKTIALANKDIELAAADAELAKKYKELADKDAEFATMIAGIQTQLAQMGKNMKQEDSLLAENIKAAREDADKKIAETKEFALQEIAKLSETIQNQIKEISNLMGVEDAKLQAQINKLVEEKFNKADFADEFKNAYEIRFKGDFKEEWDLTFPGAIDEVFETAWTKYLQGDFDKAFEKAIKAAIENGGVVSEAIKKAVGDAKDELIKKIDGVKNDLQGQINKINTKVGDILLVVGDLADRIQSVTFVPEYDAPYGQFAATLYYYGTRVQGAADGEYKWVPISDNKIVVAKFEVYPKSQASKVADMLLDESGEGGASVVAVLLKDYYTRGASEAPKAKIMKAEAENGVVSIEAVFGAEVPNYYGVDPEKDAVSFAISLRVESPDKTVVDETSGKSYDAGKYIESAYVPVQRSKNSYVKGFCLYDFTNEKEFGEDKEDEAEYDASAKRQWSAAPAKWNYFAGYDYAVRMYDRAGKECVMDLDHAAKLMNVKVDDITPSFTVNAEVKKDAEKFFDPKAEKKVVKFDALADCYIAMNETAVKADVKNAVGSNMEHCVDFKIANIGSVCHYDVNYEIIRRQVDFIITPAEDYPTRIPWTYAKAVELTKSKTSGVAYDKDIVDFKECSVKRVDENDFPAKLGYVLGLTPTKYIVTVNDKPQTVGKAPIKFKMVAQDVEDVAKVTIPGRTYSFGKDDVDNYYKIQTVYADDELQTDYNVFFEYKLGPMPKDQTVTLPAKRIKFTSGETFFKEEYDEEDYISQLTVAPYFKDAKELWTSVNEDKVVKSVTKYYKGEKNSKLAPATTLNVFNEGVTIGIVRDDLNSRFDSFGFTVDNKTWYGVTYTFKTAVEGIEFDMPDFRLAPAPDRLNSDWTGTIGHEAKYDKYVLKQDIDLSKYVTVANYDKKETELTITYAQKTEADAAKGIVNVPVINTTEVAVIPNAAAPEFPTIESSFINWLTKDRSTSFTAREDQITVVLKLEGIELDSQVMTLSTASPITKFAFDEFVQKIPEGSTSTTVNLWNNMIIEGALQPGVNVVLQTAKTLEDAIDWYGIGVGKDRANAAAYDCEVIFPEASNVEVYVGGVLQPVYNLKKFSYDPANGTITFTGDLADLVKPVEFKFKATLNYVLDRVHKDQLPADVSVTFKK